MMYHGNNKGLHSLRIKRLFLKLSAKINNLLVLESNPEQNICTWTTWGGVSRSPCRRIVDKNWRLCGQPFFLHVSFFAFTLGLSTCDVFLFLISVVWRIAVAVALAVSCSSHPDFLQHCLKGVLTIRRSCSLCEPIPVLHCPYCKWVLSDSVPDMDPNPDPDPRVFFCLPAPDPDPLLRGLDPDPALDPDPSNIIQK